MLHKGNGLCSGRSGLTPAGVVAFQQLHQGRRQLLSGAARTLTLEGMPLAIANGQQPLQGHCLGGSPGRPAPITVPIAAACTVVWHRELHGNGIC
jgi:hypothetical protein